MTHVYLLIASDDSAYENQGDRVVRAYADGKQAKRVCDRLTASMVRHHARLAAYLGSDSILNPPRRPRSLYFAMGIFDSCDFRVDKVRVIGAAP